MTDIRAVAHAESLCSKFIVQEKPEKPHIKSPCCEAGLPGPDGPNTPYSFKKCRTNWNRPNAVAL